MALQEKILACGPSLTAFGMALKFVAGPVATAIGAIAVGLRGDILHLAIIQVIYLILIQVNVLFIDSKNILQAALPQSITSFIFAREYGLHADVLSTA